MKEIDESLKYNNYVLTCTADLDYDSTTVLLIFMPSDEGTQTLCFNVSIIDDLLGNEPDEEFSVAISDTVPAGSVGDNAEACVTIINNDSENMLHTITVQVLYT